MSFLNIGVTELIVILLLAFLVVGPERLPEVARKLGRTMRDIRQAYENLTRDLGPELMSIQQGTREIRESLESVRSIPQDMVKSVVKAAELDEMAKELQDVTDSIGQVKQDLTTIGKVIEGPGEVAADTAGKTLPPTQRAPSVEAEEEQQETVAHTREDSAHE
jgi:sec-independent protein translocase protein TatB